MKKLLLSMAMLLCVGSAMGQTVNKLIEKWKAMCAPNAKAKDDNNTVKEPTDDSSSSASSSDKTGPGPNVNPYEPVSTGLNFGKSEGTELVDYNGKKVVSSIESGDYFVVNNVDFKNGASTLTVLAKADKAYMEEMHLNASDFISLKWIETIASKDNASIDVLVGGGATNMWNVRR